MFQDYLAYTASACADHKTVPRRFNHFIGDEVKVVNLENPFDLGDESSQGLKFPPVIRMRLAMTSGMSFSSGSVTPRESSAARVVLALGWHPRDGIHGRNQYANRTAEIGLCASRCRHADQHHTGGSLFEDRSPLFEAVHLESIGLVHKD
jgi:hypothetical protein